MAAEPMTDAPVPRKAEPTALHMQAVRINDPIAALEMNVAAATASSGSRAPTPTWAVFASVNPGHPLVSRANPTRCEQASIPWAPGATATTAAAIGAQAVATGRETRAGRLTHCAPPSAEFVEKQSAVNSSAAPPTAELGASGDSKSPVGHLEATRYTAGRV
jgi:hypothetical protein